MKKNKRFRERRAIKLAKKNHRNKLKRKGRRHQFNRNVSPTTLPMRGYTEHFIPDRILSVNIKAPEQFNLMLDNCELFLEFINDLKLKALNFKKIEINLSSSINFKHGAIVMLLSVVQEISELGVQIFANRPSIPHENDILEKSGFFSFTNTTVSVKNKHTKDIILKTGGANDMKLINSEIRKANETTWQIKGRNPAIRAMVFEMARNSVDHAFKRKQRTKWHFGLHHNDGNKEVTFSFVDNGKGVISTVKNQKLWKSISKLIKSNAEFLKLAFENGIESRTGVKLRGKGLPAIHECYSDGYIQSLVVITNNVYLDFDKKIFKTLTNNFTGTYYYWKLNKTCNKACFTNN
jgi:hypothetical protein